MIHLTMEGTRLVGWLREHLFGAMGASLLLGAIGALTSYLMAEHSRESHLRKEIMARLEEARAPFELWGPREKGSNQIEYQVHALGKPAILQMDQPFFSWPLGADSSPLVWRVEKVRDAEPKPQSALQAQVVSLFFGTDRKVDDSQNSFGNRGGNLILGKMLVSVPRAHTTGEIERPPKYLGWLISPDPANHMVALVVTVLDPEHFFHDMQAVREMEHLGDSAFIFVHGYNVSFEDAALRTAQMAVDLNINALPAFYSWPSKGSAEDYPADEATVDVAAPHLAHFLENFADQSGAKTIYVIAHSMGARVATIALASVLEKRKDLNSRFGELVLAAPDIDAEYFKNTLAPHFAALREQVTLYASSHDRALSLSHRFHEEPRAGEAGSGLIVTAGVETIDASAVPTDFFGHSYFADERPLLMDLALLLKNRMRAADRPTIRRSSSGLYWAFPK